MRSPAEHEALFHEWIGTHRGILRKVARSFAPGPAEIDELEQEMLLQLWLALPSFAGAAKPSTWIYRVCLNTAMSWQRGRRRRERRFDRSTKLGTLATSEPSPADNLGELQLLEQLYAGIRALRDFDRAIILLSLDGLSYAEIADVTGLTENHIGVALVRARRRLTQNLKAIAHELE
jgi:RNA polymerase sigma-70 factor (ECF subfamily)